MAIFYFTGVDWGMNYYILFYSCGLGDELLYFILQVWTGGELLYFILQVWTGGCMAMFYFTGVDWGMNGYILFYRCGLGNELLYFILQVWTGG